MHKPFSPGSCGAENQALQRKTDRLMSGFIGRQVPRSNHNKSKLAREILPSQKCRYRVGYRGEEFKLGESQPSISSQIKMSGNRIIDEHFFLTSNTCWCHRVRGRTSGNESRARNLISSKFHAAFQGLRPLRF